MKSNILIKGVAFALMAGSLAACSEDYLNTQPVTSLSSAVVLGNEDGLDYAMNGLCRSMYSGYGTLGDYLSFNGEPWVQMFYGDVLGQDMYSNLFANSIGVNFKWASMNMPQGWVPGIVWTYAYGLIGQANMILTNIDGVKGDEANLQYIKASALTIRAHAYTRLVQIYGPRWADSRNGEQNVCVIRLTPGTSPVPLSSMNDVIAQIYSDLDTALDLYAKSGKSRGSLIWMPDANVAHGVYARAAQLKEDWANVRDHAKAARNGHPIMTAAEYKGGFAEPVAGYIWANAVDPLNMGYFAHGSWYACQGPYPTLWGFGAGAINYDLYKQIPDGDIRKDLFFGPDKPLRKPLKKTSFWNPSICNPVNMDLNKNANMVMSYTAWGQSCIPNGDEAKWGKPFVAKQSGGEGSIVVPFGAQCKYWGLDIYGSNSFPFMRAAEMLLAEAEAEFYLNNEGAAIELLKELNAERNDKYECNLSGDALRDEIRLQRRIELWGEGHSWFDLKRWNLPMERRAWKEGDVNSGNIPVDQALRKEPSDNYGWRFAVPERESMYNSAIDRTTIY